MQNVTLVRTITATRPHVWAVLADYPNIADWNSGVKTSFATGDEVAGVGATRHCDLAPAGTLEETIAHWEPESKLVVTIDSATTIPIKRGEVTFTMDDAGSDSTAFTLSYDYLAKGGPVAPIVGRLLAPQLRKGFGGFIDDLEAAARAKATS